MSNKKLGMALILMGLMAIPLSGRAGSAKQSAPGQEKKNLFVGVWICKNHRANPATAFRAVDYTFHPDGTMMITANTGINTATGPLANSGFFSRTPAVGEYDVTSDNTIHFATSALYLSAFGGAAGVNVADVDGTLNNAGDEFTTSGTIETRRYKFPCNTGAPSNATCTVANSNSCGGFGCNLDGEILGEEVVTTNTTVSRCVRADEGIDASFPSLPSP